MRTPGHSDRAPRNEAEARGPIRYLGVFSEEAPDGRAMLTVAQVAERLNVSERLVRRWIADSELAAYRAGRSIRIREADAEAMLVPYSSESVESA
jgi:excisionase family DNA binding protein